MQPPWLRDLRGRLRNDLTPKSCSRLIVVGGMAAVLLSITAGASAREMVTWSGNTPEANTLLGITMMRTACDLAPSECLERIRTTGRAQKVQRWTIAMKRAPDLIRDDALAFSQLSLHNPMLVQVDLDDFVSTMKSWHLKTAGRANSLLEDVAQNVKRGNPRLGFGITLYEDELNSPFVTVISADTRALVDRVSLYLHFRRNAGKYPDYVKRVRQLFPNAVIWAGSYAYDRVDYLPCEERGSRHCNAAEEIDLYEQSLQAQLRLLSEGTIGGLEFYPGFFGMEEKWFAWSNPRICNPKRISECVQNTRRMRAAAVANLSRLGFISGPPPASPR